MLKFNYEIKGMNVRTSAFKEYILREARQSKYSIQASLSDYGISELKLSVEGSDSARIKNFESWLKSAGKGASKVSSIRKI